MGRNKTALARTVKAMRESGALKLVPAALLAVAETLAEVVDDGVLIDGVRTDASAPMWREYRSAVAAVIEAGAGGDTDDDTADFVASVRTPMGDAKKPGTANVRTPNSGGRRKAGPAAYAVATDGGRRRGGNRS